MARNYTKAARPPIRATRGNGMPTYRQIAEILSARGLPMKASAVQQTCVPAEAKLRKALAGWL